MPRLRGQCQCLLQERIANKGSDHPWCTFILCSGLTSRQSSRYFLDNREYTGVRRRKAGAGKTAPVFRQGSSRSRLRKFRLSNNCKSGKELTMPHADASTARTFFHFPAFAAVACPVASAALLPLSSLLLTLLALPGKQGGGSVCPGGFP